MNRVKEELDSFIKQSITGPLRSFRTGIYNLIKYRSIIWRDRWWDYSFMLNLLEFKLEDMRQHWGVDTHYVNDKDDRNILDELVEDLKWLNDSEKEFEMSLAEYDTEYKKRSKRFFGRLERHHQKLWD